MKNLFTWVTGIAALVLLVVMAWKAIFPSATTPQPRPTSSQSTPANGAYQPKDCPTPNTEGQTCDQTTTTGNLVIINHVEMVRDTVTGQLFADLPTYPTVTFKGAPTIMNLCQAAAATMASTGDHTMQRELDLLYAIPTADNDQTTGPCRYAATALAAGDWMTCYSGLQGAFETSALGAAFTDKNALQACAAPFSSTHPNDPILVNA